MNETGDKNNVLIVIPTYNEAENLPALIKKIRNKSIPADILVVDDSSPDGTAKIAKHLQDSDSSIYLIERKTKSGLGTAYIEAFGWALARHYQMVIQMDADGSHDPAYIKAMIAALENADIVAGSRFCHGADKAEQPFYRGVLSKAARGYVRLASGLPITDPMGGFKCWRRRALESIDWGRVRSRGYFIQTELLYFAVKNGFKIREIPIKFLKRSSGSSKMSIGIIAEAAFRMLGLAIFG